MTNDLLVFVPYAARVDDINSVLDGTVALSLADILDEFNIGDFIFLDGTPTAQYLRITNAGSLGFVAALRDNLHGFKGNTTQRMLDTYQRYELELRKEHDQCIVQDLVRQDAPSIALKFASFQASVDRCATNVLAMMLILLPSLAKRTDIDEVRRAMGMDRRWIHKRKRS